MDKKTITAGFKGSCRPKRITSPGFVSKGVTLIKRITIYMKIFDLKCILAGRKAIDYIDSMFKEAK